jgi:hypothetical protein
VNGTVWESEIAIFQISNLQFQIKNLEAKVVFTGSQSRRPNSESPFAGAQGKRITSHQPPVTDHSN